MNSAARWVAAITPAGWSALLGGLALTLLGFEQGWQEVRVAGMALLAVAVVALLLSLGRIGYQATIAIDRLRVRAGERVLGRVLVANTGRRTLVPVRMELPVGNSLAPFDLPALPAGGRHEVLFAVPTRRRGVVVIGPGESVRRDPLGLVERTRRATDDVTLYVHPQTVALDAGAPGRILDMEGLSTRDLASSDVSFHAIRPYVPGDDRRAVHWRTTARTGRLMVRQFEEMRRSHALILLVSRPQEYADPDDFELAVSAAASFAVQARRDRRRVTVLTGQGPLPTDDPVTILDRFAAVTADPQSRSVPELARTGLAAAPTASLVVLVTGTMTGVDALHGTAQLCPPGAAALSLQCRRGEPTGHRRLAGHAILALGRLSDLPRALRTVS